jgi:phosphomannomutase
MAAACIGMVQAMGLQADYYGVLPTPALAFKAMSDKVPSIMITGSHIPFDRNGLKFYSPDGEISKKDEQDILNVGDVLYRSSAALADFNPEGVLKYIKRYLDIFPHNVLSGMHIGIYEHSSAGRNIYPQVFRALGAEVTSFERSDVFVPIDTEAVSASDIERGASWAIEHKLDAIFSTDGDGDRPLIADEHGRWLRGDIVGLLCSRHLGIGSLAVPVSCNTSIEKSCLFKNVIRTKIGSPYVIEAFESLKQSGMSYAGFEANGGFLLGSDISLNGSLLSALPTRDALLPALIIFAAASGQNLSTLLEDLPSRFTVSDRIPNVSTDWSREFLVTAAMNPSDALTRLELSCRTLASIDQTDGLRMTFADGDILHFRPSGNSPELRCYVESVEELTAKDLLNHSLKALKILVG